MKKYFILIVFLLFCMSSFSQTETEKTLTDKNIKKYNTSWAVGGFLSQPIIFGDVNSRPFNSFGYGLNIQRAIGNSVALRAQFSGGSVKGADRKALNKSEIFKNTAINGKNDPLINLIDTPGYTFWNYKTGYMDLDLQIVYNFSVNDFRSPEYPKTNFYLFGSFGAFIFKTFTDQKDNSGKLYDFSTIYTNWNNGTWDQKTCKKEVWKLIDKDFETPAEGNPQGNDTFYYETEFMNGSILPVVAGGIGFRYRINDKLDASIEAKGTYTANDLIDGQRWAQTPNRYELTSNNDIFYMTSIGINYRLGKTDNIYWFDNPSAMHYKITLENKRKIALLTSDADNDGVSDYFDRDLETPEGVKVDAHGVAIDSDGDGVPDYKDKEPYSDKGAKVDSDGVSIDSDGDGVPDHKDLSPNTPKGELVNFQGIPIGARGSQTGVSGTKLGFLPAIFFDFDDARLKNEALSALAMVAEAAKQNPDQKIRVIGYTDRHGTPEYNQKLGMKRAQNVVNYLVMLGVPSANLEIVSKGSAEPLTDIKTSDADRLNRRVQFQLVEK